MNARKLASLFQFRFRTLFVAIAFVALAVTALINATPAWSHDLYCAAIVLLTLAIPLACYRSGEKRAFWAGFALFGWVYLLLIGNIDDRPRTEGSNAVSRGPGANVPTSRLTHWVYVRSYGEPGPEDLSQEQQAAIDLRRNRMVLTRYLLWSDVSASASGDSSGSDAGPGARPRPGWWDFLNVGHALWTFLAACAGGFIVRGIYILRPEQGEWKASAPDVGG